jgi:hypothetical protein
MIEDLGLDSAAVESDPWIAGPLYAAAFERLILDVWTILALWDSDCELL